jgi:hypothetical protein
MNPLRKLKQNNSGMVAIMVAVFLVLIISLVVVNYSQLVRREQRQVLDRQLNTQALYVAESGVEHIAEQLTDPDIPSDYSKTDCANHSQALPGDGFSITNLVIDPDFEITCSLVEKSTEEIVIDSLSENSEIMPLDTGSTGGNINSIEIRWKNNGSLDVSGCNSPDLTSYPLNCSVGVLRVDLVNTANLDRNFILGNTYTAFLYPGSSGSNSMSFASGRGPTNQGRITETDCSSGQCVMRITGMNSPSYHIRLSSIFRDSDISITGVNGGGSRTVFYDAQAIIDVTARASDVIRRVRTVINSSDYRTENYSPVASTINAALQTADDICKQYTVIPNVEVNGCER